MEIHLIHISFFLYFFSVFPSQLAQISSRTVSRLVTQLKQAPGSLWSHYSLLARLLRKAVAHLSSMPSFLIQVLLHHFPLFDVPAPHKRRPPPWP